MSRAPAMLPAPLLRRISCGIARGLARGGPGRIWASSASSTPTASAEHRVAGPEARPAAWRASLDFKKLRDNVEAVARNCHHRKSAADVKKVITVYEEWVQLSQQVSELREMRNAGANEMKGKLETARRAELIEQGKALKETLTMVETKLAAVEDELQREGQRIPNDTHPDVPIGEEDVAVVRNVVGQQRVFDFPVKDHVALATALDMVDFDNAHVVSGTKFYYLRNAGAMLELALINWTMLRLYGLGFTPLMTPDLVRESILEKCGFQPRMENTQVRRMMIICVYSVANSELCLTGTAEVPLGGIYMDQILAESALPIKMCAFGHCFRTEAGAAGASTRGLYRVHQFSKVEMFVLSTAETSDKLHQELIDLEVEMFSELGLHFKVLDMPTADLGAPAYRKFDVEAWMPGLGRYGEISSASNCTDYQSRRLNIRYRPEGNGPDGKKRSPLFVHTLNATACAVPRMVIAILENNQQEDGSVLVPVPLRPFLGGLEVIKKA